jgi:WhiB family redox-sensing transcriptional regulator
MFAYSWTEDDEVEETTPFSWESAACRDGSGSLTALFFSDEISDVEVAKAICGTCELAVPCLRAALARREPAGVWGGQLFADGEVIARKRKRGRPPKVAAAIAGPPLLLPSDKVKGPHCVEYPSQQLKTA